MNQLKILMHIDSLSLTVEEYTKVQSTLQKPSKYITDNYLFAEKIQQKPWKASYKAINKQTGLNQFLQVYEVYKLTQDAKKKQLHKLRESVRQQMRMNSDYVISCQDCLQNDNFFIIAKQYCPEQTLKQRLAKSEKFSEFECVKTVKQLICALAELYRQNIYLDSLNVLKIKSVEGVWKLNQFENCYCDTIESKCIQEKALNPYKEEKINPEKKFVKQINRNEKTRQELVIRAMYQLGKVFCQMAFGMIEIDDEELSAIGKDMVNFRTVYGISLSEYARQFLKLTLSIKPNQKSKLTWKQLIQLKLFIDETRRISNTQFLKLSLLSPQQPQLSKFIPQPQSQQHQLLYKQQQQLYLQYKKTELLLHQILKRIETQHQCFSLANKQLLQILYLICVRCINNCARLQWLVKKVQHASTCIEKYINKQKVQEEEIQANKLFYKYSAELTNKENEKVEIVKDWINVAVSISQLKFFEKAKRNKFLGDGFEHTEENTHDYSKEDQINFTSECIKTYLKSIKNFSDNRYHVYFYLMHYKDILDIKFEDLTEVTFQQKVRSILSH